ncbi:MAG TPA: thioesterase family protein [Roseiflexaceae bacterium]|nr:thioesterase family protein [Roseiflexaceae bacterium]
MNKSSSEGTSIEITLRARYAETDAMGVVHHASYIVWLEQGRTELLRARGTSYREIEAAGYFVVLSDLQVRYHASARYDDLVSLRTTLVGARSRQISFAYGLRLGETGALLVSARSEHIVVSRATGRPARLPLDLLAALG